MVNNPHQLLGVSENATQEEIKRAYRRKAKECHPDLHPNDPNAAKKMNELNEAYDMLMNPDKYKQRQQQQNPYGNPYGQSYGQSYGGSSQGSYQQGTPYGQRQSYGGYSSGQGGYQRGGWQSDFGGFGFEDLFGFGGYTNTQLPPPTEQPGDPTWCARPSGISSSGRTIPPFCTCKTSSAASATQGGITSPAWRTTAQATPSRPWST